MSRTRIRVTCCAGLCALICGLGTVDAQAVPQGDCGYEPGGTVRGVVVDDSTGVPVARSHVYLFIGEGCRTAADGLGRFVVRRVPSGVQRIETGSTGYRPFEPTGVTVVAGDTVDIELRLVPGGPLEDCRALPSCAPLVEDVAGEVADDDTGFRVVALGTAIGLAWSTVGGTERWHACLEEGSEAMLQALRARYSPVGDAASCELSSGPTGERAGRLRHVETDHPAFRPRIDRVVELNPSRRTVSLSYHVGPRWGAGWDCDFVRNGRGWRPTICVAAFVV